MQLSASDADSDLDSAAGKKKKKKQTKPPAPKRSPVKSNGRSKKVAAPPSLPPPPPPPPPPPAMNDGSSSSFPSSSDMSSSDSSDFSESETTQSDIPLPPPMPPGSSAPGAMKAANNGKKPKRRAAMRKKVTEANSSSLKVTLKLPPGFATANGSAALRKNAAAPPNSRAAGNQQKTVPAAGSRTQPFSERKARVAAQKKQFTGTEYGAVPLTGESSGTLPAAPAPIGPAVLPKLIPTGPTIPAGEIRGFKELSLVDPHLATDCPEETIEEKIPAHFNDPYAHGGDTLRILDMFFFCDEHGKPISLEILDKPKDQRPKIMGFGTVVEHLPLAERPPPVKYILPSPAFPSRSKKRPRADSSSSTPAKSPATKTRTRPNRGSTTDGKRAKIEDDSLFQGDGEFEGGESEHSHIRNSNIFHQSAVYRFPGPFHSDGASQMDGESDSDSGGSNLTSDDEDIRSARSGSFPGSDNDNDSELLSSASSSSSESGSDNEVGSGRFSLSTSGSDAESGKSATPANRRPSTSDLVVRHPPQENATSSKSTAQRAQRRRSTGVDSRNAGLPLDVVELMRTDQPVEVNAKGTPDELNLMECGFRHPPEYARARVWLPEITDWCLDYAEGDPTLWVVTPYAWYKIAGPLSGLLPHPSYRKAFQHVRHLFEASYLVAYVLKEWLPINKKVSYRATLQQIIELSLKGRYRVSAWFLVKNYPFIRAQISNLFPDKETYLNSMFFKQLQRLNQNYTLREARHQKEMAEREVRRTKRENERLRRRQRVEEERQRLQGVRDEERKIKQEEERYPTEDLRLLEGEAVNTNSLPVASSSLQGIEGPLLGELIMAWQTITTFKDFVGVESISLEALIECFTTPCDDGNHVGLSRIFMAFLRVILAEKSFIYLMDDLAVEGNIKVSDLFINSERTYGMCERAFGDMLNAVTWQEILRQLMSKDLGIDSSIGHVEPLVGCEIVRQTLYMQTNSSPFNAPVDTSTKGLEDYSQIVKTPMDLGTIKKTLESGGYEGPQGYDNFAADIRLVWDNAISYNGEESEVGRAAIALSDVFEQDYERFVTGRVRANESRIEGCKKAKEKLEDPSLDKLKPCQYADVVYGLYNVEFHELPISYKVGALSWICSEFLTLSVIRTFLGSQVEQEMLIYRNYRKRAADLDSRRKHSDKMRREKENAFRRDCISQGIHPNSHNVFSEGIKRKHTFIPKFYEDMQAEKTEDENAIEQERTAQAEEMQSELASIVIREAPLGRDRYHNSYFLFKHDIKPRLFIERGDSGDFVLCSSKAELLTLLEWLNPKGIRELALLTKLEEVKDKLLGAFEEEDDKQNAEKPMEIRWNAKDGIELHMFPLPGGAIKGDTVVISDADKVIKSCDVSRKMLLSLKQHLEGTNTLPGSWEGAEVWSTRLEKASSFKEQLDLFAELESAAVTALNSGVETIRLSWQRKRHEWRLALEGSCTYAQLIFLLHVLLEEFINVEAFMDLHIRLDRREWLKLRPKETRNYIPEVGNTVVYFGDGHALALKEDEKSKKKRFTQKSDSPVRNATVICTVEKVSFHHGGGDPYALAVLKPISDMEKHECVRQAGSLLCPLPSREQRLARVFLRILAKLKLLADAGPFLEPVSDREFPQYKEIIPHPMDLGKMTVKAANLEYKTGTEFMTDLKLMRDNCQLFCEGRFPTLPPLAHNLVSIAGGLVKKWGKEIRACEDTSINALEAVKTDHSVPAQEQLPEEAEASIATKLPTRSITTILRLENRLPEYVVDANRYVWAVNRTWHCGERFRMLFRDPQGQPGEYYGGITAGSLPFDQHGMLPWEALRVTWDEDDGSDDNRINPWEAEFPRKT